MISNSFFSRKINQDGFNHRTGTLYSYMSEYIFRGKFILLYLHNQGKAEGWRLLKRLAPLNCLHLSYMYIKTGNTCN